jgi:hypothetical protein
MNFKNIKDFSKSGGCAKMAFSFGEGRDEAL